MNFKKVELHQKGERVSIIEGNLPLLFISPHGWYGDDHNTDYIAEFLAVNLGGYAVINRGWRRTDQVDVVNSFANCNSISQNHEKVVFDEFLEPILEIVDEIEQKHPSGSVFVFNIHGVGSGITDLVGFPIDIILGHGDGKNPRFSCSSKTKNLLTHCFLEQNLNVALGKAGGAYAGYGLDNLNQLFVTKYPDDNVQSVQLEIIRDLRDDDIIEETASDLVKSIMKFMSYYILPSFVVSEKVGKVQKV